MLTSALQEFASFSSAFGVLYFLVLASLYRMVRFPARWTTWVLAAHSVLACWNLWLYYASVNGPDGLNFGSALAHGVLFVWFLLTGSLILLTMLIMNWERQKRAIRQTQESAFADAPEVDSV